jgi:hypothetical protein
MEEPRTMTSEEDEVGGMFGQRRANDRVTLVMMYTLNERVSSNIKRVEEYITDQKAQQREVKDKLVEHEAMVIKTLNSWHWFTLIVTVLSSVTVSLGVYGYNEFITLREVVSKHTIQSVQQDQRQVEINKLTEQQIRMLMGGSKE